MIVFGAGVYCTCAMSSEYQCVSTLVSMVTFDYSAQKDQSIHNVGTDNREVDITKYCVYGISLQG